MKRILLYIFFALFAFSSEAQTHSILFKTDYGNFKVLLYDFTPAHRDLMLKSIKDSTYQGALFNRIIANFVVQGGEHDVDIAAREAQTPSAPKPRLAGEFNDKAFHKNGALGAGRDDNKEKASFLNQIYFVVGKKVTMTDLTELEKKKGIKFSKKQIKTYLKQGGLPRLDKDYTVFGEIYEGLDVILKISQLKTDKDDYPLNTVKFEISMIK